MTEVTVRPGDTLWGIEQQLTGSGANWQQGWQANAGRPEPGGATYTDPDLIQPGWTLTIPTPRPATPTTPAAPPTHPTTGPGDQHAQPTPHDAPSPSPMPPTPTPTAPSTPAQSPEPTGNSGPSPARTHADSSSASDLPMLAFAGGGGLLLAGLALTALTGYRRRQFRHRRPGRIIAGTPAGLVATERAVRAAGSAGVADVTWLDQALRGLVQTIAGDPDGRLPDVIAVRLTADELTLVLAEPAPAAPPPWRVDDTGGRWTIQRADPIPYEPDRRGYYFAPYPTLTSVGHTAGGEHWLLDLERIGALSLVGDRDRCLNLARFLAAELAHNTWSEMLQVTLVGFGSELVAANPDRLTYTDDLPATLSAAARERESVLDAIRVTDVDLLTGRLRDIAGDTWAPHVVLVAPPMATDDANDLDSVLTAMRRAAGPGVGRARHRRRQRPRRPSRVAAHPRPRRRPADPGTGRRADRATAARRRGVRPGADARLRRRPGRRADPRRTRQPAVGPARRRLRRPHPHLPHHRRRRHPT